MTERVHKSGFLQYNQGDGWKFAVAGFDNTYTGQDGFCNVLHIEGEKRIPIDKDDRITIDGKKYTRRHWEH